jgi:hypothetical protein
MATSLILVACEKRIRRRDVAAKPGISERDAQWLINRYS